MLARQYRFSGQGGIRYVYRKGATVRRPHFTLRTVPVDPSKTQVAVVVSKKVAKLAVTRNRIRRRIYAALEAENLVPAMSLMTVIIVQDTWAEQCVFSELRQELAVALHLRQ